MAALVLAARSARARVIAPDASELITRGRAPTGLDVSPAVDRRRGVLQLLGPARREPGRHGGFLTPGWPGVSAAAALRTLARLAPLVPLVPLTALTALATLGPASDDEFARVGRNDPCPCGSGRKYKRCHGDPRMRPDL